MILINWAVHSFSCSSISQKPADLNLQCFHKKDKYGFSRTRVNMDSSLCLKNSVDPDSLASRARSTRFSKMIKKKVYKKCPFKK